MFMTHSRQSAVGRKYFQNLARYFVNTLYVQLLFSFSRLISSKNLNCFRRRGETGGHARRWWSAKFHNGYVKQHHINPRSSPDYWRYKTVLPDSHALRHVTIVNRHFREAVGRSSSIFVSMVQNALLNPRIGNHGP